MTPRGHIQLTSVLLAISVAWEVGVMAGVFGPGDGPYHALHLALMASVVVSQAALFVSADRDDRRRRYALWFAVGMALTAVGDYVNSALSPVQPVSRKLTWALVLFGLGYASYGLTLWRHGHASIRAAAGRRAAWRHRIALPFVVVNALSWFLHVEPNVAISDVLYYGSFVFNLTVYVALPTFAAWYLLDTDWSIGGLVVVIGAVLIPYSDLVLFASWLRGGDPAAPPLQLYALNWILYFAGQVLISMFPALVLGAPDRDT